MSKNDTGARPVMIVIAIVAVLLKYADTAPAAHAVQHGGVSVHHQTCHGHSKLPLLLEEAMTAKHHPRTRL